jgi:thiol-disulfide isomerase/thioredoxin
MRTIQRLTTLLLLALTVASAIVTAQEPQNKAGNPAYDQEIRKADALAQQRQYEAALQSYKKAFALTGKTSYEACLGMALAYRGLGAYKNVADACTDALKLATDPKQQANVHNLHGMALVELANNRQDEKKLREAEQAFRAALAANETLHVAHYNMGIALIRMHRDEEGVQELQRYVDLAPGGKDTAEAIKTIAEPRRARESFAPDFSFTSKDGEFISLADVKGKVVVLDFWGTWCGPCVMATPGLVKLHKKFAEQPVVFISVAENDREEAWAAYVEQHKMVWPQFLDRTRKMVAPFGVRGYPTYIVIDPEGIVQWRVSGYGPSTDGEVESEIKKALKEKKRS